MHNFTRTLPHTYRHRHAYKGSSIWSMWRAICYVVKSNLKSSQIRRGDSRGMLWRMAGATRADGQQSPLARGGQVLLLHTFNVAIFVIVHSFLCWKTWIDLFFVMFSFIICFMGDIMHDYEWNRVQFAWTNICINFSLKCE